MEGISRRDLIARTLPFTLVKVVAAANAGPDPWEPDGLVSPVKLAEMLRSSEARPVVISVGFPVLYRQRHIVQAIDAGPASKPEGLAALRKAVSSLPKNAEVVIYCGCCPMDHCPNIRPAYAALVDAGFRRVRVLELRTNLRTDWTEKGYPVSPPVRAE